ncbi:MAG: efflux RND transporter periplasmic adaptor subunit [Planctomycetota bacterium]
MRLPHSLLIAVILACCGCGGNAPRSAPTQEEETAAVPTNRTPIPAVVRRNLGITFANATYRPVAETVTLPGHFEVLPSAQHHYPLPAAGRVTVLVSPLDKITKGQLLLQVNAPSWRSLQTELADARANRTAFDAKVARALATRAAARGLRDSSSADSAGDVYDADVAAAEAERDAALGRIDQLLAKAASMTGLTPAQLKQEENGSAQWQSLQGVPVYAVANGIVREVDAATGTWVAEGTEVVHIVQPDVLRFRARALQADLFDRIRDGQSATIAPPEGRGAVRRDAALPGTVRIGVTGDPVRRTMDVFIDFEGSRDWVRPFVAALADVVVSGSQTTEELAIPTRAIIQDGLETVLFRRAPDDPDQVIRVVADLGVSDGRWVSVLSGLAEGDEVVIDGIYELKLATSARKLEGGHFHADGTWHEEDH